MLPLKQPSHAGEATTSIAPTQTHFNEASPAPPPPPTQTTQSSHISQQPPPTTQTSQASYPPQPIHPPSNSSQVSPNIRHKLQNRRGRVWKP